MPPFCTANENVHPNAQCTWGKGGDHIVELKESEERNPMGVRFAECHRILEVDPVPDDCKSQYWLSPQEYVDIRNEAYESASDAVIPKKSAACEFRGLESRTAAGMSRRSLVKTNSIAVVLQEQDFQRRTGYVDIDELASVYRTVASKPSIKAKIMGMRDEIAVNHNLLLRKEGTLRSLQKKRFDDFKKMAESFAMSERMEL